MQLKPQYESFKVIESIYLFTDDGGDKLCLTLFEVKNKDYEDCIFISSYKFWTVVSDKQEQWNNKAISYSSNAFYKSKEKPNLFNQVVGGFHIEEIQDGTHYKFSINIMPSENEFGLRTKFKLTKVS